MKNLAGRKVLMFIEDLYEDLELWYPKLRLEEENIIVTIAGPHADKVYHGKNGYPCRADSAITDAKIADLAATKITGIFDV